MSTTHIPTFVAPTSDDLADLHRYLPAELRGESTIITRIAAGMSGAGVYRVRAHDTEFVLKITAQDERLDVWRAKTSVQQAAAGVGIAPQVIHVDENGRAVLSELIADQSFGARMGNPSTREVSINALGNMLRQLHALPIPTNSTPVDPVAFLAKLRNTIPADFPLPAYARQIIEGMCAETPPHDKCARVLSHNDVNPTNLVFDGTRVLLLDWQTAAPNSPYYDLAAFAMFFRLDEVASRKLLSAHGSASVDTLPAVFRYFKRFSAVMSGAAALHMARLRGHTGGDVAVGGTPSLGDIYQQMRAGSFDIGSVDGQWMFGLALVKEGMIAP
ncbi:MAG: phosphotransferase [Gemmatimonadaceae bacterium]